MSESQFEKMCKALSKAERQLSLSRHTVEVQDKIVNELRDENARLRELMKNLVENAEGGDYGEIIVPDEDFNKIEREVGDE